jgi:carbon-monoxide dehydrogenase medium subunit
MLSNGKKVEMEAIKYFRPKTLQEACFFLSECKGKAKVIAGGTDLLVAMKHGEVLPDYMINIKHITGLDYIIYDKDKGLSIGVLATIRSIETSSLVQQRFAILAEAASKLGTRQVRNQGTIGGNLCTAATSADTVPALMVLGTKARIVGGDGDRIVNIEDFFTGPGQTILKPNEILAELQVPNLPPQSAGVYIKHTIRKALDLAIVGVAALVTIDEDILSDVKIALGTVAPTPIRARRAEEFLRGKKMSVDLLQKAGQIASEETSPRDSLRASASYRREMVKVLVKRAVKEAVEKVKGRIEHNLI